GCMLATPWRSCSANLQRIIWSGCTGSHRQSFWKWRSECRKVVSDGIPFFRDLSPEACEDRAPNMALQRTRRPRARSGGSLRSHRLAACRCPRVLSRDPIGNRDLSPSLPPTSLTPLLRHPYPCPGTEYRRKGV